MNDPVDLGTREVVQPMRADATEMLFPRREEDCAGENLGSPIRLRQLVEALVDGVEIDTIENECGREAVVSVRYRFNPFSSDCTGNRASFNCTLERTYRLPARRAA